MKLSACALARGAVAVGLSAALGLAASACAGGSGTTPPAAGSSPPSGTSSATGASPAATHSASAPVVLTGTSLNKLLLPASAMPAGFRLDVSGVRNSGQGVSPDAAAPVPASKVCGLFTGTSWILAAGVNSATFAQNDYVDSGKTQEVAQEIDTFTGTDAQKVLATLWKEFGRCRAFTQAYNGMTVKTTLVRTRLSSVGIKAAQTSPTFYGGTTLTAIRIGNTVITCLDSSAHSDDGAAAVTLARRVADEVKQAQKQS